MTAGGAGAGGAGAGTTRLTEGSFGTTGGVGACLVQSIGLPKVPGMTPAGWTPFHATLGKPAHGEPVNPPTGAPGASQTGLGVAGACPRGEHAHFRRGEGQLLVWCSTLKIAFFISQRY